MQHPHTSGNAALGAVRLQTPVKPPLPPEITGAEALFKMPFMLLFKIIVIFLEAWGGKKNGVSS